jgi:hypothetical protein
MADGIRTTCPHCNHALAVPEDWLGRVVTCLECQRPFRAPVRDGESLTAAVPLTPARTVPAKMFVPLYGLLLLGLSGSVINAFLLSDSDARAKVTRGTLDNLFADSPAEAKDWKAADRTKAPGDDELRRREIVMDAFQRERERSMTEMAAKWPDSKPYRIAGLAASMLTTFGGFAFLLRRGYIVAFIGCLAAAFNSPDLGCCFAGAIVAAWGFLALISEEGRRYFGRIPER